MTWWWNCCRAGVLVASDLAADDDGVGTDLALDELGLALDGPPRTLREIAGQLGLSAERVRQIEERALGKLRETATAG